MAGPKGLRQEINQIADYADGEIGRQRCSDAALSAYQRAI